MSPTQLELLDCIRRCTEQLHNNVIDDADKRHFVDYANHISALIQQMEQEDDTPNK